MALHIRGSDWLAGAREAWTELLECSTANPLFLDWRWQHTWWKHFADGLDAELRIVTATDQAGRLSGIAPFVLQRRRTHRLPGTTELAALCNSWRTARRTAVTEHLDWIIRSGSEDAVPPLIAGRLAGIEQWRELVFSYTSPDSIARTSLMSLAGQQDWYVRTEAPITHFSIDTSGDFADFVQRLGRSARRRLFAGRSKLGQIGTVALVSADRSNLEQQLDKLDALARKRWGDGLSRSEYRFYAELAELYIETNELRFSTLEIDGTPISALYDIATRDTVYNIRSALDGEFRQKLSPGMLHLGYAIENACADAGIRRYALLAGGGKRTDFKKSIADLSQTFVSFQVIRGGCRKFLYRLYDRLAEQAAKKDPEQTQPL